MPFVPSLLAAFRCHWRHYLAEAAGLAFFITWGSLFTTALEHPASPLHQALSGYSPWGKQSGAHINPAVTLAFWHMGKIRGVDALWYVLAQVLGGIASACFWTLVLGDYYSHPSVHHVTTKPGPEGPGVALAAEFIITFILMATLLTALHHKRLKKVAGWLVGSLLAIYILFESPYSGMSLNPARSLASAVVADDYEGLWVYFVAPVAATWLATVLFLRFHHGQPLACAIVAGCEAASNSSHAEEPPHYPAKEEE
jgi:aquaporin Z